MPLIRPFAGLRPAPGQSSAVLAPPSEVLNAAEARRRAADNPWSFLRISKPEIDLPPDTKPYADIVYQTGARNLRAMIDNGVLQRDPTPCYYLYRLQTGEHVQTGLVALASVHAYEEQWIRRHEFTRPDKEEDRVRQIDALNAQTGPVLLAHQGSDVMARWANEPNMTEAVLDVTAEDGIRHTLWVIDDPEEIDSITEAFAPERGGSIATLYIADGHHRSAAAARVAAQRRQRIAVPDPNADYEWFLSVIFPAQQMRILDYNRVVRDLHGLSIREFLTQVSIRFDVTPVPYAFHPTRPREFGLYLDSHWYRMRFPEELLPEDSVERLDVSLLQTYLIDPVLGIVDPRRDERIEFIGGIRGLSELERRVDNGEMAVAFALHPTTMEQLISVADAHQVMPPKSTWFEPKLADGLISHQFD